MQQSLKPESEQVLAIKKRYKESLPDKAAIIKTYMDCFEQQEEGVLLQEQMEELHEFLHKLAGSSGMYGFTEIAQQCRQIMSQLQAQEQKKLPQNLNKVYNLLLESA